MDIATIIGILVGFFIIVGSIIMGGGAKSFVHVPSFCITMGGMICASLIHFSLSQVIGTTPAPTARRRAASSFVVSVAIVSNQKALARHPGTGPPILRDMLCATV